jgi:hypothetical protein
VQICRGAEVLVKRWCRGAGAEQLALVLRFRCRRAAIAVVLVLLVQILLYWCRGGAARWCSKVVQRRWCRCRDAGAELGGRTEHRCVDVQTEMQRCEVHRHGGEEVQRWCSKVVKMFSGAE